MLRGARLQYFVFCCNPAICNTFPTFENRGGKMKRKTMNTAAGALAALLLCGAGAAWANSFNPWLANGLNKQIQQNREAQQQPVYGGPSAAEIRAWHEREAEIQARIARHRATPYWMAIGRDWTAQGLVWAGGHASKQKAMEEAVEKYQPNCEVIAVFANACGVLVYAHHNPQSINDLFIGIDRDDKIAAAKAMQSFQAVHGKDNPDRCFYSAIQTKNSTVFCADYDYSVYGQE